MIQPGAHLYACGVLLKELIGVAHQRRLTILVLNAIERDGPHDGPTQHSAGVSQAVRGSTEEQVKWQGALI